MAPRNSPFGTLTRRDLTAFDQKATDLILSAIEFGCIGRVSNRGHAILRNNTGKTTAVPRTMSTPNRSAQNARAQVKRLLASHRPKAPTTSRKREHVS